MTLEKLQEILAMQPALAVKELQVTSYPKLPKWSDLLLQYDPMKHSILDTVKYPAKLNDNQQDDFKRTPLGLQKLAVNRIAQSMFSTPVIRTYGYDKENEKAQNAVNLLEELYRIQNYIDSENIERCKALNASCQIATVWRVIEDKPTLIGEETSKFSLSHNTYSEMDGYKLYPINDPFGDLLVVSIGFTDTDNIEHLYVYANMGEKSQFIHYIKQQDWIIDPLIPAKTLEIFPVVYSNIGEPVWGGLSGTTIVEQLEEMESYQGLYIKRNALPSFTLDYGEVTAGKKKATTQESSSDARRIIEVGKGGGMKDVTWEGASAAVTARYERLRNSFFEQIQVPDTSFANMIKSNTSAENKELIFADAKAKARDLGGEWEKLFYNEMLIVKKFASIMFSTYKTEFETISVRSSIQPYSIKTKKEAAEYISIGGSAMSLSTQVKILGEVDDIATEVETIQTENNASVNQGAL